MQSGLSQPEVEAIDWVIRSNSPGFRDWTKLADWLASSTDNAAAFNRLSVLDAQVADQFESEPQTELPSPANDDAGWRVRAWGGLSPVWRWTGGGGAIAAGIALVFALSLPSRVVVETGRGEIRQVAIDDGVTVQLNGSTRIEYERSNPRTVELAQGEAWFDVQHGTGKFLDVRAGDIVMRDLGTTFNVVLSPTRTELAVSQGRVVFDQGGRNITVELGQGVRLAKGRTSVDRFAMPVDGVASWKTGKLVFRDAGIVQVAEDLSRRSGLDVSVSPEIKAVRFTGTITVSGLPEGSMRQAAVMMGVPVTKTATGWRFGPET